jgi:hypothetical protein
VETVSIGPYIGEYVAGGWKYPDLKSVEDITPSPITPQTVWDTNVNLQTLRWSDSEFLFEIILAGGSNQTGFINEVELIELAKNMH